MSVFPFALLLDVILFFFSVHLLKYMQLFSVQLLKYLINSKKEGRDKNIKAELPI